MNIIKESLEALGVAEYAPLPFSLYIAGERGARVTGVKRICLIGTSAITLAVKGGELAISGEDLFVRSYGEGDVVIGGKISGAEVRI